MKTKQWLCGLTAVLFAACFAMFGCSKHAPPTANNVSQKRTLSGVYQRAEETSVANFMRWDFRTDGTVIFKAKNVQSEEISSGPVERTIEVTGVGAYKITNELVNTVTLLSSRVSYQPNYGVAPKDLEVQTNEDLFRIDGDDLIHLSVIIDGKQTNSDAEQARYMKRRL